MFSDPPSRAWRGRTAGCARALPGVRHAPSSRRWVGAPTRAAASGTGPGGACRALSTPRDRGSPAAPATPGRGRRAARAPPAGGGGGRAGPASSRRGAGFLPPRGSVRPPGRREHQTEFHSLAVRRGRDPSDSQGRGRPRPPQPASLLLRLRPRFPLPVRTQVIGPGTASCQLDHTYKGPTSRRGYVRGQARCGTQQRPPLMLPPPGSPPGPLGPALSSAPSTSLRGTRWL